MKIVQCCVVLALLAGLALAPRVASAQAGTESDYLAETVVDLGTGTGAVVVPLAPPAVFVAIPEGVAPCVLCEIVTFIDLPPREIDFLEGLGPAQHISDRLRISPNRVRVESDPNPGGLMRRDNATLIPASALENFQPIRIEATSDGNGLTDQPSDTLTITLGYYGPGTGTTLPPLVIPEPLPDTITEPVVTVGIPPMFFDVEEPPIETGGVLGKISDYVDILTSYQVTFISSDNLAAYDGLPPANGFIVESDLGGGVRYSLDFHSDVVPEPTSFVLLSIGLLSAGWIGRRRAFR